MDPQFHKKRWAAIGFPHRIIELTVEASNGNGNGSSKLPLYIYSVS